MVILTPTMAIAYSKIIRLNTDGSIDNTFSVSSPSSFLETADIKIDNNDKIYIGGFLGLMAGHQFKRFSQIKYRRLGR